MESQGPTEHTLWLWPEGMFPRRITFWLLMKGLVASPADLLAGKTKDPSIRISLIRMDISKGFVYLDTADPAPQGASSPCLRIHHVSSGAKHYIHESSAILAYLERAYSDVGPALAPQDPIGLAIMDDLAGVINLAMGDSYYYIKHSVPQTAAWSGLKNEERSHAAAINGYASMVRNLVKLQWWAEDSLQNTGWLTPAVEGPGVIDITLASGRRYLELTFGWNIFEKEELKSLAAWYERFQAVPWWKTLEERENVHPPELQFGKDCREV